MTDNIYVGDNGTVLEFTIKDNGNIVDIRGGSVEIDFRIKSQTFSKQATIIDGQNGIVQVVLTGEDITTPGTYLMRGLVTLSGGNSFHSDKLYFIAEDPSL